MTVPRETLERIVALAEKATPGPWAIDPCSCGQVTAIHSPKGDRHVLTLDRRNDYEPKSRNEDRDEACREHDAQLILLARNTAPDLARTVLEVGKILGPDLERCNHANDIPLVISKDKAGKLAELLGENQ